MPKKSSFKNTLRNLLNLGSDETIVRRASRVHELADLTQEVRIKNTIDPATGRKTEKDVPGGRFLDDVDIEQLSAETSRPIDVVEPTVAGLLAGAMR